MHIFHKWSRWGDLGKTEVLSGDAVLALIGKDANYKPVVTRIDLRQERRCLMCNQAQYRRTSA